MAWYAIMRANKTTSAATMVSLSEAFRNAWVRLFQAQGDEKEVELAELLNLFEIACAISLEGSLSGNSAVIINEYLQNALLLLAQNEYAELHVGALLQSESTFVFIRGFLKIKRPALSVTIPAQWYES